MKYLISTIFFLVTIQSACFAQNSINSYKYILIPEKFDFFKDKDKYQINSLTLFLFNKYGYNAFMVGSNIPADLEKNRCLGLIADVDEVKGGFLRTKIQITLKDCNGTVIAQSKIGDTKIKEYAKAYNVALREAFETFQYFEYQYRPESNLTAETISQDPGGSKSSEIISIQYRAIQNEAIQQIETLKREVEALKKAKTTQDNSVSEHMPSKVEPNIAKANDSPAMDNVNLIANKALYAQPMNNGFQVVDTQPKKVMFILKTGLGDVYNVEGKNALVYKKGGKWYYEIQGKENLNKVVIDLKF